MNATKKKSEVYQNKFFKCCICNKNLCPICKTNHNKEHLIIDYELKNFICNMHGERFTSYCNQCHKNLCDLCELDHNKNHKFIYHREIMTNIEIKNNLNKLRNSIDDYKNNLKDIIKMLNKTIDNLEIYYSISNNIINNYQKKNRNFQILNNLNNIDESNQKIIKDIDRIINEKEIDNKIKNIINIYNAMINKNNNNLIVERENKNNNMILKIDEDDYQLNYKAGSPSIKENFPLTPNIGLDKIEGNSYLNSILQCFCHI